MHYVGTHRELFARATLHRGSMASPHGVTNEASGVQHLNDPKQNYLSLINFIRNYLNTCLRKLPILSATPPGRDFILIIGLHVFLYHQRTDSISNPPGNTARGRATPLPPPPAWAWACGSSSATVAPAPPASRSACHAAAKAKHATAAGAPAPKSASGGGASVASSAAEARARAAHSAAAAGGTGAVAASSSSGSCGLRSSEAHLHGAPAGEVEE